MTIDKKTDDGIVTLSLAGWMDTQNAPLLADAVCGLEKEARHLVLDFINLEYTSSAGIRCVNIVQMTSLFLNFFETYRKHSDIIMLLCVCGECLNVFHYSFG